MPTVLITGANRGIGLEFARQYAAAGWKVIGTCRFPAEAKELQDLGGTVRVFGLDVTQPGEIRQVAAKLEGQAIDVLIANAGVYGPTFDIEAVDQESWLETLRTNIVGPALLVSAFLPNVRLGQHKKIVALSSKMGSIGDNSSGGHYAYRSSKAGLNAVWRSLAHDLANEKIWAVMLHPGWVKTRMGGDNAQITPEESVSGMRVVIDDLSHDTTGRFWAYDGREIPW